MKLSMISRCQSDRASRLREGVMTLACRMAKLAGRFGEWSMVIFQDGVVMLPGDDGVCWTGYVSRLQFQMMSDGL